MIDTVVIRALLVKVLTAKGGRPAKALINQLSELVGELCDAFDEQDPNQPSQEQIDFERTIRLSQEHLVGTIDLIARVRGARLAPSKLTGDKDE